MMWFFVKLFERECYANDFRNGKLFINRLSFFKNMTNKDNTGRVDSMEGANYIMPNKCCIGDTDITNLIDGPIVIKMDFLNYLHVFCLYAGHTNDFGDFSPDNFDNAVRHLQISDDYNKFGPHSIVVTDGKEFIRRVTQAAKDKGYRIAKGLVQYYDPDTVQDGFGDIYSIRPVFMKRNKFSYQREYRFVIDTHEIGDKHICLDVGDISDITMWCDIDVINRTLSFRLSDKAE